ncbi:MAG: hypothetical protein RR246_01945 [Clostridia bacterium]
MKKIKIVTVLFLSLCTVITFCLSSCNKNDTTSGTPSNGSTNESKNTSGSNESKNPEDTSNSQWVDGIVGYLGNGKWGRDMPEFKWKDKKEFKVLVYNNETQSTYFSEEIEPDLYTTTDQRLSDSVRARNEAIFNKYGVKVKAILCKDVYKTLKDQLADASNADNADAAMPFINACSTLAQEGNLYNLYDFEKDKYIDLSMPWWDQRANKSLSISDALYFTTGDMSIMQKIVSGCVVFNKDLFATKYPDVDLYDMVDERKWTFDKMYEYAKEFTYESGGDTGELTYDDTWGLITSLGMSLNIYQASGGSLCTKNAQDIPVISLATDENTTNMAKKILDRFNERGTWAFRAQDTGLSGNEMWNKVVQVFGDGHGLFYTSAFSALKKLRPYESLHYGILPRPLYNELQTEYFNPCVVNYAYGSVIPMSAPIPEFSAFMLDVISQESRGDSKTGITSAYTDVVLKGKDLDSRSGDMLDKYIFSNITYDIGLAYAFGAGQDSIANVFVQLENNASSDISSHMLKITDAVQSKIDEMVENFKNRID